ncbi:CHAT domain-containing protein [Variovorax sp. J31P179]|uniref:CHAT domain-containing protein n=1 Tax=Variovorax sp. J31P179 TaxID=3053508 RepID=UPI002574B4BE|nr:CHAT domain-containing protein [Variovorax sp. J31P179]MDM0085060.1 CHAT domain-containing protein [Variovorax sp. J31P179]
MTLTVSLINGDLAFISGALLIGHYTSLGLTGSEAAIDRLLAGKLQRSLRAGDYPEEPGSTKIFRNTRLPSDNPWQLPRPAAVIVVGLGQEVSLQADGLKNAIAAGAVAWALYAEEQKSKAAAGISLAATLIGSGGLNISAGQSAQLIVQAVLDANARLAAVDVPEDANRPPVIESLTLVDLYLDRAGEAWRALTELQFSSSADFHLEPRIAKRDAALDRPLESSYRGSSYDLIVATWEEAGEDNASVRYRLDTRRARSEIQAQSAQVSLLRQLLADGSNPDALDRVLGRTLFRLLVPVELAPFMASSTEMQIEVDAHTAAIPWELLDTPKGSATDQTPWAMRTKLLRKLRTVAYRPKVDESPEDAGVLVIGEPACPKGYARLPGARREARAVQAMIRESGWTGTIKALIASDAKDLVGADGRTIMRVLLDRPWRIVHICGHGEAATQTNPRGVVLTDGAFLGPREVANMRPVPELVIVNCCFAGAHSAGDFAGAATPPTGALANSQQFAANVTDQLMSIGVRCVVATGWAVDDEAAEAFASAFYKSLLRGSRFMDAVASGREAARAKHGNTWAAYQCYGDPDWRLRLGPGDAQAPTTPLAMALTRVASVPGLVLALRTLSVRARYHHERDEAAPNALRDLERRFDHAWGHQGDLAEAFGNAWLAMGDRKAAAAWLERAVASEDGAATFKAAESLLNLRVRVAFDAFQGTLLGFGKKPEELTQEQSTLLRESATETSEAIEGVVEALSQLSTVAETSERSNLCGSAWKRLAMISWTIREHEHSANCVARMREQYARGWQLSQGKAHVDRFYSAMNVLAAAVASGDEWDPAIADQVRRLVDEHHRSAPDFWNATASVEIAFWEALAVSQVTTRRDALAASLADLHDRVSDPSMWSSVLDQTRFVVTVRGHRFPPLSTEQGAINALMAVLSTFAQCP